jgi:hypothetical protein
MTEPISEDELISGIRTVLHREPPRRGGFLNRRNDKDIKPHHIQPGSTLPVDKARKEVPSMQEVLDAADRDDYPGANHYGYLRDVGVSNDDLAGRLRHRAALMRQRADQFDEIADRYRNAHLNALEAAVRSYDELSIQIQRLLDEHKHVEPTKV